MPRAFALIGLLLTLAAPLRPAAEAGQPGGYLRVGVGARAAALGDAMVAAVEGPDAAYWNPAALAWASGPALSSSLNVLSLGRQYDSVALQLAPRSAQAPSPGSFSLEQQGGLATWALTWLRFSLGNDFEGRRADTASFYSFSDRQAAYILSHGRPLTSWWALGAGIKVYDRTLESFSASGGGLDLGTLILLGPQLRLGVSAGDLGSRLRWSTGYEERIPVIVRSGLSYRPWDWLQLNGQLSAVEGRSWAPQAGLEAQAIKGVWTRLGWKPDGLSVGAGLRLELSTLTLSVDYAYYADPLKQGDAQRVGVGLYF